MPRTFPVLYGKVQFCWGADFAALLLVALSGLFLLLPGCCPSRLPLDCYGNAYRRGLLHVPAPTLLLLKKLKNYLTCTRLWCRASGHPAAFQL